MLTATKSRRARLVSGATLILLLPSVSRAIADSNTPFASLAGTYSSVSQGTLGFCVDPTSLIEQPCSSTSLVLQLTNISAGSETRDKNGKGCATFVEMVSTIPLADHQATPTYFTVADQITNFDPTKGIVDGSFTTYSGGKCNGASFDDSGATVMSTGAGQGVLSNKGAREDGVFTSLTDPVGGIGAFSLSYVRQKQ